MLAPALDCEFPPEEEVEEVRTDWMYLNIWDRMGSTWREKAKIITLFEVKNNLRGKISLYKASIHTYDFTLGLALIPAQV